MLARKTKVEIPVVKQLNRYECGICCLSMILSYYRYDVGLTELREYFGNGRDGINLLQIKRAAESFHLAATAKRVPTELLGSDNMQLPAIAFYNENHYVVIDKVKKDIIYIVDPAKGRIKLHKDSFSQSFSGVILDVAPNPNFKQKKQKRNFSIINVVFSHKKLLYYILLISLLLQLLAVGVPIVTKYIIDLTVTEKLEGRALQLILAFFSIIIFQVCFLAIKNFSVVRLQNSLDKQLMNRFVSHLFKLPYKFFELRSRGDLIYRANSNIRIREFLSQQLLSSIINIFLVVVIFGYMLIESKLLALTILSIGLMQVLTVYFSKQHLEYLTKDEINNQTMTSSFMTEVLGGISTVKSLGIENQIYTKWEKLFKQQLSSTKKKADFEVKIDTVTKALHYTAPLVVVMLGIYQIQQGDITLGTLFAFQSLSMSFLGPLNSLATLANDIVTMQALLDRIDDVLKSPVEKENNTLEIKELKGAIKLNSVYFKYHDNGHEVVQDVSLNIDPGQKVAIVGKSGSGKSTLAALLVGLYKPTKGEIFFDELPYEHLNKSSFRKNIGVVLQENFLFNKSVYENIIINQEDVTSEDVEWAAEMAALTDDIKDMPMGFNTVVSETGSNFSGGQKQRIALARALVGRPSILLLDEATSALDSITESRIEKSIQSLNCTRIVIAHRLSTVKNADQIIVLEDGQIVDVGTHEELMIYSSKYQNLYSNSSIDKEGIISV
ncbi:ATP-binding cassette domain-containing protein [Sediminibacillus dalangtanensis]|uniref:ATP-binding cassette domain-containing protein n=1 Tax=Sediminibacillus dalangtanensis TaxID=2729421 RepID=A0ABX7VRP6_9BACI|nr:peptidase domain-containing ABC transporter [Sediminibacillus dalangtanensis]QTM98470.1 ATP-binding cassette domain-containing protein [Sediminibacillus dalangtanensis]